MLKAIERRREEQRRAIEAAARYLNDLATLSAPLSGIVYGSMARGDFGPGSDTDVLVISDRLPEHPLRRLDLLFSKVSGDARIEPKGLTIGEFTDLTGKGAPWLAHVLREGILLRDDLGLLKGRCEGVATEEALRREALRE